MRELSSLPAIDLGRLAPSLGATCGDYLRVYRAELEGSIRGGAGGVEVATRFTRTLDGLLSALFCAADAAARRDGLTPTGRVALVGVGGYGRRVVGPHSDVDVLFLSDQPADPYIKALAEGLLYPLWDLGLMIGHSVGGVDDLQKLAREDIPTATMLLDLRRIAGDGELVKELASAARRHVFEPALAEFLSALESGMNERHERFGGSLFLLEPEVKLGRGGLRDLDVALWAARARWGGDSTEDLVRKGALLAREVTQLEEAREFLWRVRNRLHLRAGRKQDRLTFADQEEIAEELGFEDGVSLAVEQFMQTYYRHARTVAHHAERIMARAHVVPRKDSPARSDDLEDGTLAFDGKITLAKTDSLTSDPCVALRLYKHVVQRGEPPYAFARDAIARAVESPSFGEALRGSPEAHELFLSLLSHSGDAPLRRGSIATELHDVGLLLAMIPEFEPITGRVQHDVYHVYTVDVHSIAAVDHLRALARGDLKRDLPFACRLAAEAPRKAPLYLAVLLHDIGKARGKDHAEKGALMVRPIAERFGLTPVDVDHVAWLVEEHLSLYHWSTRRDTSDPEAIAEIARKVGTVERLRDLFLMTVVDMATTNPTALTSWKAHVLEDLYIAVTAVIEGSSSVAGESGADLMRGNGTALIGRAVRLRDEMCAGFAGDEDEADLRAFVREMPDRYLLANPPEAIREHARAARERDGALVHVGVLSTSAGDDVLELAIVTDDRPGLLADLSAVLAAHRLDVASAQIFTRQKGEGREAFDVFTVRRGARGGVDDALLARLRADAVALLRGDTTIEALLARGRAAPAWAKKHLPDVPTEIIVDNAVSAHFAVVDAFTRDRPGLLHVLARTIHEQGFSISLSKIHTEGARVTDVFYIEDESGGKPRDAAKLEKLAQTLREELERFHEAARGEGA